MMNGSGEDRDLDGTRMIDDTDSCGIELAPPSETPAALAMRERLAERLFGLGQPQRLDHYVIERRLGSGGMGVVYAAQDTRLDRKVAIKLLHSRRESPRDHQRLHDEARALAQLSHPNVVQVYEVGTHEGQLYLVMELVVGQTLERWAASQPRRVVLSACIRAGEGLAAAHAAGLVHRDVKPNNIIVGRDGRPRVVDFGLARTGSIDNQTPRERSATDGDQTSHIVGTPTYMAPEVHAGESASPLSDQFSFCVTIWEVVAGTRPFSGAQLREAAETGASLRLPPLRPRWLRSVLCRGMAPAAGERWSSMDELLERLESRPRRRALVTAALGGSIACGLAYATVDRAGPACPDSTAEFGSVWGPVARARVERALELQRADERTIEFTVAALDDARDGWVRAHTQACEATRVHGSRSLEHLDLAFACLERQRAAIASAIEALVQARETPFEFRDLLAQLDDSARCNDPAALYRQPKPPTNAVSYVGHMRARVDRLRMYATTSAIDSGEAEVQARGLASEADALGFDPVRAEVSELRGVIAQQRGDGRESFERLRLAATLARASGAAELEYRSLCRLVSVVAVMLEDPARAEDFMLQAEASLVQLGSPPELVAEATLARARLAMVRGDLEETERLLRLASAQLSEQFGPHDIRVERVELDLASVIAEQGRSEEAREAYLALLAKVREQLGPENPEVAALLFDLGLVAFDEADYERARAYTQDAVDLERRLHGPHSPKVAPNLALLAYVYAAEGEQESAIAAAEAAWTIERDGLPRGHSQRGNGLKILAALLAQYGRYERALAVHELIEDELRDALPPSQRAVLNHTIAWLMCRVGRCVDAKWRFEAALLGDDYRLSIYANIGLAEIDLALGEPDNAAARLERALPQLEALEPDDLNRQAQAEAWILLARANFARGIELAPSRELLNRARGEYEALAVAQVLLDGLAILEAKMETVDDER